jgi:hypothetical protein
MKRIALASFLCALAAVACSRNEAGDENVGSRDEGLTYTGVGPLSKKSFAQQNENTRQLNTADYYASIQVSKNGVTNLGNITTQLPNLTAFKDFYGFGASDTKAFYYNRGDLGIGREMHCVDKLSSTGQVACYVRNFAAGDDQSEFRFGMSQDVAFKNMDASVAFATVAMVFRKNDASNKVFFVVYGQNEARVNAAPLDRHGLNFALGKTDNTGAVGTPGVNFNNHIPSNCLNCHGGSYDPATKKVSGGLFLPFDLDQFDYQNTRADRTRAIQEPAFKALNTIVRGVAAQVGGTGTEVVSQIDGWYAGGSFNSGFVPSGWSNTTQQIAVYNSVVKGACRGCHMTSPLSFSTAAGFVPAAVAADLCSLTMPHALQNMREFWQSTKPLALENYFRSLNTADGTNAANTLHACSPKSVVTLDPHRLMAATSAVF